MDLRDIDIYVINKGLPLIRYNIRKIDRFKK